MRSIRVLRNVVSNYLRFFVGGLLGLVLTPIMVRIMGDGDYGLWIAVFSLTGYFGIFDQGIRPSLVRYVARDHALGDRDGLSRTMSSALVLYSTVGVVVVLATMVASANFTRWFNVEPSQAALAGQVVMLAGITIAVGFPFGVFAAALSGLQRYDLANGIGVAVSLMRGAAFVVVLHAGGGIIGLAWTSLVMSLVGHVWTMIVAMQRMSGVRVAASFVTPAQLRMIGAYSGFAFIGALANNVAFQTDALVITAFLGAAAVTPFAIAAGLVDNVRSLVNAATWVLTPTASELEALGEESKLHGMLTSGTKYSVLLSWPVLSGLLIFGPNFLETWVGAKYVGASGLLAILTVPTFLSIPQSVTSAVLFGVSRHKAVVVLALLNALLNLGLSLLWVTPFGLTGVALGTALPLAAIIGIAMPFYGCRAVGLPLGRYVWEGVCRPGIATVAFVVPALVCQKLWHPVGWGPLFYVTAGSWVVFAVCAWRLAMTAEERAHLGRTVLGLLGRGPVAAGVGQ